MVVDRKKLNDEFLRLAEIHTTVGFCMRASTLILKDPRPIEVHIEAIKKICHDSFAENSKTNPQGAAFFKLVHDITIECVESAIKEATS